MNFDEVYNKANLEEWTDNGSVMNKLSKISYFVDKINSLADELDDEGANVSAAELRQVAKELK